MNISEWNASSNKSHLYNEVLRRSTERFFLCECRFGSFKLRSALENVFLLEAHNCDVVNTLTYEKVRVPLENGRTYIPDFLVNGEHLVECKAKKDQSKQGVLYKAQCASFYADQQGWLYHLMDFSDYSEFFSLL